MPLLPLLHPHPGSPLLRKQTNLLLSLPQQLSVLLAGAAVKHTIHLLQSSTLRLRKEEPNPSNPSSQEPSEKDVRPALARLQHRRDEKRDGEVVDPVKKEC